MCLGDEQYTNVYASFTCVIPFVQTAIDMINNTWSLRCKISLPLIAQQKIEGVCKLICLNDDDVGDDVQWILASFVCHVLPCHHHTTKNPTILEQCVNLLRSLNIGEAVLDKNLVVHLKYEVWLRANNRARITHR